MKNLISRTTVFYAVCFILLMIFACSSHKGARVKSRVNPDDKEGMVLIPGGEFLMGVEDGEEDAPAHMVFIDPFYLDQYEVTNARYFEFCRATGRKPPGLWEMDAFRSGPDFPNHPVVGVTWGDAKAYAAWCGKRLPTEAEWEYSARGGLAAKNYPGGDEIDETQANYYPSEGTEPVGSYPPNGYGLYDMAGNALEWVADYYEADYYTKSPYKNPTGPEKGKFRALRGGGWHTGPYCTRVYFRNGLPGQWIDFNVGFRCAKDYSGEK